MPTLAENKKARFDYEVLETLEAGLVLTGQEAKSTRNGGVTIKGSFVTFRGNMPMLTGAQIAPYKSAGIIKDYDPTVSRKLLFSKKEIYYLKAKAQEEGLTIVPLKVYTKARFIKLEVAVARGKKTYDKREAIKKRDFEREKRQLARR